MTLPSPSLSRLALRRGLSLGYRTATGTDVTVSAEALRRILAAMGFAAATDEEAEATEAALAAAAATRRVAPTVVVKHDFGGPLAVAVRTPPDIRETTFRVLLEDGAERAGAVSVSRREDAEDPEAGIVMLPGLPHGYHTLWLPTLQAEPVRLIVTPTHCWLPQATHDGRRLAGVAVQSYLLRSPRNWGIGDMTDLTVVAAGAARAGYDLLGLPPLHLLFPDTPAFASPYAPASRLLLNTLTIDPTALPEWRTSEAAWALAGSPEFRAALAAVRAADFVDYEGVARLKYPVLRLLWETFRDDAGPARRARFEAFRRDGGRILETTALFLVLRRHFADAAGHGVDWAGWPAEYQDPDSPTVRAFAAEHADEVGFEIFLQFAADEQTAAAATAARTMRVGLYRDLAVGCDAAGAETWVDQRAVLKGLNVGAPPDYFTPAGQNWCLPPFDPTALAEDGYRSFVALVRANMRHAGALRIDHVMSMARLFVIPAGHGPDDGTYLAYPLEDLVGILSLESHRNHCLVVGEDLGVVPSGFRERMAASNILSYRVMLFEQDGVSQTFCPPEWYPWLSVAVTGSHDLPTLRGWWTEIDIDIKERLAILPDAEAVADARARRAVDREKLCEMLRAAGVLAGSEPPDAETFAAAAMAFPRRAGSAFSLVQLDDLLGETQPVNVPGTTLAYPNWRRRYRRDAAATFPEPA